MNRRNKPEALEVSEESNFLFNQFVKSIEYLTWSNGRQREYVQYIRLKQKNSKIRRCKMI